MTKSIEKKQESKEPKTKKRDGYKPQEYKENGVTTKYVGHRTLRDCDTGELVELEYLEKKVKHDLKRGWRRVYLENFMELLSELYTTGRKIDVIEFILNNLDSENKLTLTQRHVANMCGVAIKTVNETFKFLIEQEFMKKVGTAYIVNPKYVCAFGSDKKNANILIKYQADDPSLF